MAHERNHWNWETEPVKSRTSSHSASSEPCQRDKAATPRYRHLRTRLDGPVARAVGLDSLVTVLVYPRALGRIDEPRGCLMVGTGVDWPKRPDARRRPRRADQPPR